jgi:hypothetical protein
MTKRVTAGLLALGGTCLKVYQWYFSRPLWLDEQMVLLNARDRTLAELMRPLWLDQAAPVGWMALQHTVMTTFGTADRAMRALPVLCGIATIWVAWWLAQRWMRPVAAAVLVALCGVAQWMTFYALEVKPYSADALSALFLPALAIWAADNTKTGQIDLRKSAVWWVAAAAAQWFSFGAISVTPALALILFGLAWRRSGERGAALFAIQGTVWLVFFAAQYMLVMRTASGSEFLRNYWAAGFPPDGAGIPGALRWLALQAQPIAAHPGATTLWWLFWISAAYGTGVLLTSHPVMGLVIASVPISAAVLAVLRLIPLHDRLALWIIPALYAAIAVAAGDIVDRLRAPRSPRRVAAIAAALLFSTGAWVVVVNILQLGEQRIIVSGDNHGVHDRRAVRILLEQRQPGDVLLTNHFALPAMWWYGNVDIGDPNSGSRFPDGTPLMKIEHVHFGVQGCRRRTQMRSLSEALAGASRAAVYLGFASRVPPGFQERVLHDLAQLGSRVFYTRVAQEGLVAIFDLREPPAEPVNPTLPELEEGCVHAVPAERW